MLDGRVEHDFFRAEVVLAFVLKESGYIPENSDGVLALALAVGGNLIQCFACCEVCAVLCGSLGFALLQYGYTDGYGPQIS
jgi:hypothetical protein